MVTCENLLHTDIYSWLDLPVRKVRGFITLAELGVLQKPLSVRMITIRKYVNMCIQLKKITCPTPPSNHHTNKRPNLPGEVRTYGGKPCNPLDIVQPVVKTGKKLETSLNRPE